MFNQSYDDVSDKFVYWVNVQVLENQENSGI